MRMPMLGLLLFANPVISLKVFESSMDKSIFSTARPTDLPLHNTTDFTVCWRHFLHYPSPGSILDLPYFDLRLSTISEVVVKYYFLFNFYGTIEEELDSYQEWHHYCLFVESKKNRTAIVRDGVLKQELSITTGRALRISTMASFVRIGRFSGKFADLQMWDKALSLDMMKKWTLLKNTSEGNILKWSNLQWSNATTHVVNDRNMTAEATLRQPKILVLNTDKSVLASLKVS